MMAKSAEQTHQTEVTLVPTDRIRVLNPRVRNPRTFADMVENIAKIGLKRPITVTRRTDTDPQEYDLVCGQGRLEAFIELKQIAIPAICQSRTKMGPFPGRIPGHERGFDPRLGARGPQIPDACQGALAEGQFMASRVVWDQGLRFRLSRSLKLSPFSSRMWT